MVSTLDVLSGGRAWLGTGAGDYEDEARGLGLPYPPTAERFEMLEETVQVALDGGLGLQVSLEGIAGLPPISADPGSLRAAPDGRDDPKADPRAVVVSGPARFTVLTPALIRMEWAADSAFEDHASLVFLNRRLPVPNASRPGGCDAAPSWQLY